MVDPRCANPSCLHPRQRTPAAVRKMVDGLCNACYKRQQSTTQTTTQPTITPSLSQLLDQYPSQNGVITVHSPTAGRPRHLLILPSPDTPSSIASPRVLRRRSSVITTCIDAVSTKRKLIEQQEEDVAHQLAYCLKKPRTARLIRAVSSLSSTRVVGQLTVSAGIALKASGMTWSHMRYIRTFFKQNHWPCMLPCESRIRKAIAAHEILYETGFVDSPYVDKPKIAYIHIQVPVLWLTIKSLAMKRYHAGQLLIWPNQLDNELLFVISIDKGGHYTKLLLTWLNHDQPQSDDASLMLGMYQGGEDHALMSLVFRALLSELARQPDDWCINVSSDNKLAVKSYKKEMKSHYCSQCNVNESTKPTWLARMKINNIRIYYGGDMPSIGELIGLSGHSGTYFCNMCTCTLSQLEYSETIVHALHPPDQSLTAIGSLPSRTLQSVKNSHNRFIVDGDGKSAMVQQYYNCIRPCLVNTEIDNYLVPTPLHLVMGLAERLLDDIEVKCKEWGNSNVLQSVLHAHMIRRSNQYGGKLTGDAAIRFFNITTPIVGKPSINNIHPPVKDQQLMKQWCTLVNLMATITHLLLRASPLCDHEVNLLIANCTALAWKWRDYFIDRDDE